MNSIISGHSARMFKPVFLFILLSFVIDGCKEDAGPTGLGKADPIPSVAGHYVGNGRFDFGPPGYNDLSVTGDIAQTADSLRGTLVWVITTAGSSHQGYTTTITIKGKVTTARVITIQETAAANPNNDWNLQTYTGTLSSKGDTIACNNVLPFPQQYPIGTLVIVKQ